MALEPQLVEELTRFIAKNAPFAYLKEIQGRPIAYWKEAGVYNVLAFHSRSNNAVIRFQWTEGLRGQVQGVALHSKSPMPVDEDLGEITLWLTMANYD